MGGGLTDWTPSHSQPITSPTPSRCSQAASHLGGSPPQASSSALRLDQVPFPWAPTALGPAPGPRITALSHHWDENVDLRGSWTNLHKAELFLPQGSLPPCLAHSRCAANTSPVEEQSDPDTQLTLWVSESECCLPTFPRWTPDCLPPMFSSAGMSPTETYLVNEILKYLKVFLLGMFSTASLIHMHGRPPPAEARGPRITRQVACSARTACLAQATCSGLKSSRSQMGLSGCVPDTLTKQSASELF